MIGLEGLRFTEVVRSATARRVAPWVFHQAFWTLTMPVVNGEVSLRTRTLAIGGASYRISLPAGLTVIGRVLVTPEGVIAIREPPWLRTASGAVPAGSLAITLMPPGREASGSGSTGEARRTLAAVYPVAAAGYRAGRGFGLAALIGWVDGRFLLYRAWGPFLGAGKTGREVLAAVDLRSSGPTRPITVASVAWVAGTALYWAATGPWVVTEVRRNGRAVALAAYDLVTGRSAPPSSLAARGRTVTFTAAQKPATLTLERVLAN